MTKVDHQQLASDFLRALRGSRSQLAFSRRLRYRSNVAASWEGGRRFPTASVALVAARRTGHDVEGALVAFHRVRPRWLDDGVDPASPDGVARFLDHLRGDRTLVEVARRAGHSRFAVARWLAGRAEPRLPDLFALIDAMSGRCLDFVAAFVDPAALPSAGEAWRRLTVARAAFGADPRAVAVFLALELTAYQRGRHDPGLLARATGLDADQVEVLLGALVEAGAVRREGSRYVPVSAAVFDTRGDPDASRRLRAFWAEEGVARLRAGDPGVYSYNVFTCSEAGWQRIEELERAHFRALRQAIAESGPAERVGMVSHHLVPLDRRA